MRNDTPNQFHQLNNLPPAPAHRRADESRPLSSARSSTAVGAPVGPDCTSSGLQDRLGLIAILPSRPSERIEAALKTRDLERCTGEKTMRRQRRRRAGKLLYADRLETGNDKPFRLERCGREVAPGCVDVAVHHDAGSGANRLVGLVTCDSWACPTCAERKAAALAREIAAAITVGQRKGLHHFHLVLTLQHDMFREGDSRQSFAALRDDLYRAKGAAFAGRWYMALKETYGLLGHVRVSETTVGDSGWHPHMHIVWWCKRELSRDDANRLEADLYDRYSAALARLGRHCSEENGVKVIPGNAESDQYLADYLAKMAHLPNTRSRDPEKARAARAALGDVREVAYAPAKRSRPGHFTPSDLLAIADGDEELGACFAGVFCKGDLAKGKAMAGKLWTEYFYGTRGRTIVDWSPGLRELLEVEQEVKVLEVQEPSEEVELGYITHETWPLIRDDLEVLAAIEAMGNDPAKLREYLAGLGVVFVPTGLRVKREVVF